jgi:hypothetical protein
MTPNFRIPHNYKRRRGANLPVPSVGTSLTVNKEHLTKKATEIPCFRVELQENQWVAIDPSLNRGLLVFLTHPLLTEGSVFDARIIELSPNRRTAFAELVPKPDPL